MNNPRLCAHCGAALDDDARFCEQCGQPVSRPQEDATIASIEITAKQLEQTAVQLKSALSAAKPNNFTLAVVGWFKNGKSTLLNALLGQPLYPVPELSDRDGPLAMDTLPCTAVLTRVKYSDRFNVKVWNFQGGVRDWPPERYLEDSMIKVDYEETCLFFQDIREFEIGYPSDLGRLGITVIDTPSYDDDNLRRSEVTRQVMSQADITLVVFLSDVIAAQSEHEFVNMGIVGKGLPYFMVVNMRHGRENDPRFKAFVWKRLVTDMLGGEAYQDQDFTSRNIFFVDCQKALEGVRTGNTALIRESGLDLLKLKLFEFLLKDRFSSQQMPSLARAEQLAQEMETQARQISQLAQSRSA